MLIFVRGSKYPNSEQLVITCPNCFRENPDSSGFCNNCGKPLVIAQPSSPLTQTTSPSFPRDSVLPPRRANVSARQAGIAVFLLLVFLVTIGWYAYTAYQTQQEVSSLTSAHAFVISVNSSGCWTGAVGGDAGTSSVQGCGSQSWHITAVVASADFQMNDAGNVISMTITKDGISCASQSSSADYGVVSGGC